jgi:hypothetical protein
VAATAYHYQFASQDQNIYLNLPAKKDILIQEHIATHDFKNFCEMLES